MRVAHLARITPQRCGLYETARDLVAAERKLDIDAFLLDPFRPLADRGVPIGNCRGVDGCDVLVSHSGLGVYEKEKNIPFVHVLHGRPESSFLLERTDKVAVYTYVAAIANDERYKAFVTFWPEHRDYWSMFVPEEKLHVVSPPVDLEKWTPDGPKGYKFGGKKGEINCVITDMWREDKTPFHAIHGFHEYAKSNPGAKLHLYGINGNRKGIDVMLRKLKQQGSLGEVKGHVAGLENVYRAADMVLTPHRIATRTVREALACGCPVVADVRSSHAQSRADVESPASWSEAIARETGDREQARERAEMSFSATKTAGEFADIFEQVTA